MNRVRCVGRPHYLHMRQQIVNVQFGIDGAVTDKAHPHRATDKLLMSWLAGMGNRLYWAVRRFGRFSPRRTVIGRKLKRDIFMTFVKTVAPKRSSHWHWLPVSNQMPAMHRDWRLPA